MATSISDLYALFRRYPHVSTDTRRIEPESIFFALRGATFDGNRALSPRWRLLGHAGVLHSMGGEVEYRRDWTLGLGLALRDYDLQLTWGDVDADAHPRYHPPGYGEEAGWVLRLTRNW